MTDFLRELFEFFARQIIRFQQKDKDGWSGWDAIYEDEYQSRAIENIKRGDYIDGANLCFLADFAKQRGRIGESHE